MSGYLRFGYDKCMWGYYWPATQMSSCSIMNDHVFQSANEHKGMVVKSAPGNVVAH